MQAAKDAELERAKQKREEERLRKKEQEAKKEQEQVTRLKKKLGKDMLRGVVGASDKVGAPCPERLLVARLRLVRRSMLRRLLLRAPACR